MHPSRLAPAVSLHEAPDVVSTRMRRMKTKGCCPPDQRHHAPGNQARGRIARGAAGTAARSEETNSHTTRALTCSGRASAKLIASAPPNDSPTTTARRAPTRPCQSRARGLQSARPSSPRIVAQRVQSLCAKRTGQQLNPPVEQSGSVPSIPGTSTSSSPDPSIDNRQSSQARPW